MHKRRLLASRARLAALGGEPGCRPRPAQAVPRPREIMDKVTITRKLDGSEAVVKMTVIGEKGETRERQITMATKLYDGGKTEKRIYRFLSPADVQGTGILVFDYEAKSDDVWIYLPALRKTRRIVSSQRAQSLHGERVLVRRPQHPGARRVQLHAGQGGALRRRGLLRDRRGAQDQGDCRGRGLLEEDLLGQQGQDRRRAGAPLRQGRQAARKSSWPATSSCSTRSRSATGRCTWR